MQVVTGAKEIPMAELSDSIQGNGKGRQFLLLRLNTGQAKSVGKLDIPSFPKNAALIYPPCDG